MNDGTWQPSFWFRLRAAAWAFAHAKDLDLAKLSCEINARNAEAPYRSIFAHIRDLLPSGWHQ